MKTKFYFLLIILFITSLVNTSGKSDKNKSDEIQAAKDAFKRMMESAHPTPVKNPKLSLIPLASEQTNPIFLNVNLIVGETEQYQMQNESSIAVNPKNPKNLIASAVDYRGNSSTWIYVSKDGGKTWINKSLGKPYPDWRSTNDPSVAFDMDGTGYFVYGGFGIMDESTPLLVGENGIFLAKTTDEGDTWKAHIPIIIHRGTQTLDSTFEDKYYISVDQSTKSPYFNHLYVPWKRMSPRDSATQIVISKSTDKGETWSAPVNVSHRLTGTTEDTTFGQSFPLATTGPNGELYVVWNHGIEHGVGFAKSLDGGLTFSEPRIIQKYNIFGTTTFIEGQGWRHTVKGKVRAEAYPAIVTDIYRDDRKGFLYLCWAADSVPNIYFSRSTDGGDNWSEPIIVHSDLTNDQFWPWIAIDPKNGDLAIMYLDSRDDPNNIMCNCYVSYSNDGGLSWVDKMASDISSDLRLNPFSGNAFAGDYNGCAFYDGIVYPSWVDMRNAKANIFDSEVFTAYINVKAPMPVENFASKIIPDKPTEVELSWDAPKYRSFGQALSPDEFNYVLFRNNAFLKEISSDINFITDIDLTPYELYDYHIYVASGKDTSLMRETKAYPGGSKNPAPPEIVSVKGNPDNTVELEVLIPNVREDKITPLVNLNQLVLIRDSIDFIPHIIQKSDTGSVVKFSDKPNSLGYYTYSSIVQDNNNPPNSSSPSNEINVFTGLIDIPYNEPFDNSEMPKYKSSGDWGLSTEFYKTPPHSLTESPEGKYINKKSYTLQLFPLPKTYEYEWYELSFWHAAVLHTSDTAYVEVSLDDAKNWFQLAKYNKTNYEVWQDNELNSEDWRLETINVSTNSVDGTYIRFRVETDYFRNDEGWYIDDIKISPKFTGVNNNSNTTNNLNIYPNPANNLITLYSENTSLDFERILIVDVMGKSVDFSKFLQSKNETSATYNVTSLPEGIYMMKIFDKNFDKISIKFIISR